MSESERTGKRLCLCRSAKQSWRIFESFFRHALAVAICHHSNFICRKTRKEDATCIATLRSSILGQNGFVYTERWLHCPFLGVSIHTNTLNFNFDLCLVAPEILIL